MVLEFVFFQLTLLLIAMGDLGLGRSSVDVIQLVTMKMLLRHVQSSSSAHYFHTQLIESN